MLGSKMIKNFIKKFVSNNKKRIKKEDNFTESDEHYKAKLEKEKLYYKEIKNVHELPVAFHYITNNYLYNLLNDYCGIKNFMNDIFYKEIEKLSKIKKEENIEILSIGSGNCYEEIDFSYKHNLKCQFTCIEINDDMINRGIQYAKEKNVNNFKFIIMDINNLKVNKKYDIIYACHSLHHFINLEKIFDVIYDSMHEESSFIINDMIGRNGHMYWDSTFDMVKRIWKILPPELKYNHQHKKYYYEPIQWDCSVDGFEGIRAQDILLLLDAKFSFLLFVPFFCIINRFIDRDYGHNYDLNNKFHVSILDFLWQIEEYCLKNKLLKPTQMFAVLKKVKVDEKNKKYLFFSSPSEVYNLNEKEFYSFFY